MPPLGNIDAPRHKGAHEILRIETGLCLWPNGDPRDKSFSFCAEPVEPGSPYCSCHAKMSTNKSSQNRNTKTKK